MARKARRPSRPARTQGGRKSAAKPRQTGRIASKKRTAKAGPQRRRPAPKKAKKAARARRGARVAVKSRAVKKAPPKTVAVKKAPAKNARAAGRSRPEPAPVVEKTPRLDRPRRILDETTIPTPPSSLDLDRHPSAARSGHEEMRHRAGRAALAASITAGDSDVNPEVAYFVGDEAPGGDNPSPDQDVVEEIGKALGVEYNDSEELRGSDKIADRDKHRWELDPASSEDYRERKR